MHDEVWKEVPRHPNYRVSNLGNLQSNLSGVWKLRALKKIQKGRRSKNTIYLGWNAKLPDKLSNGRYRTVTLKIHIIVAAVFIGPCPDGMLVLHKDDNKNHNAEENLYYGTHSQNMKDATANGRFKYKRGDKGHFSGSATTPNS